MKPYLPPALEAELTLESFEIVERVDSTKRYRLELDPAFPLAVRLYEFPAMPGSVPMTWHERLEIFCPLAGAGAFRIGEHIERFEAGDILLIDNLRLHGVERFEGKRRRALVVVFHAALLAPPGALPCDLWLLRPFHHLRQGCLRLAHDAGPARKAWEQLRRLVAAHANASAAPGGQARQKSILAELVLDLEEAFRDEIGEQSDYENRRERLRRLAPLLESLSRNSREAPAVPEAARMLRMSPSYFMRFFHDAAGLTYRAYVDHLRVNRAYQLLRESDLTLTAIAAETGFCDQSHLSRHIRRRFGAPPGRIRAGRG